MLHIASELLELERPSSIERVMAGNSRQKGLNLETWSIGVLVVWLEIHVLFFGRLCFAKEYCLAIFLQISIKTTLAPP